MIVTTCQIWRKARGKQARRTIFDSVLELLLGFEFRPRSD